MQRRSIYRQLGWRHQLWELVRLYRSLRVRNREEWCRQAIVRLRINVDDTNSIQIAASNAALLAEYLAAAEEDTAMAFAALRTEEQALSECRALGVVPASTNTKNRDHHQSSKALVAEVSELALAAGRRAGVSTQTNPQRRAVWVTPKGFHVSARNLDGVIPGLLSPYIVWEIKEYWGKTAGGSKMSDAVYECHLVGRDLREFTEQTGFAVLHVVFLDGRDQWMSRRSDLMRFIDLFQQGLIDDLIIGSQTAREWPLILDKAIQR